VHVYTAAARLDFLALADGRPQFPGNYHDRDLYRPDAWARIEAVWPWVAAYKDRRERELEGASGTD